MRVLILGGSYFLGPRIVTAFRSQGWSVTVLNRGSRSVEGVEQLVADRNSEQQLREALGNRSFDAVVDVSCYTGQQAASAGRVLAGRARSLTLVSTAAVYADNTPALSREGDPTGSPNPWGEYGAEKSRAEQEYLRHSPAPALTILRASYLYGPDAWDGREARLWQLARGNADVVLPGDGSTRIQLLHVDDFAAAVLKSVESARPAPPRIYNVAGPGLALGELVGLARDVAGGSATVTSEASSGRPSTAALPYPAIHCNLDPSRIESELGWRATTGLEAGLAEAFAAYARKDLARDAPASAARSACRNMFRVLAGTPSVADAEIVPAEDGDGFDVHVVADAAVGLEALAETLRSTAECAVRVRRVSAIPLDSRGRTDLQKLRSLPAVADRHGERRTAASRPVAEPGNRPALIEVAPGPSGDCAPPDLRNCLEQAATTAPGHTVSCYRSDGRRVDITYRQLAQTAYDVAGRIDALGIRPGETALLPVGEVDDFVRLFWGCVVAGVVPVPISKATVVRDAHRMEAVFQLLDGCWTLAQGEVHELARAALKSNPAALTRLKDPLTIAPTAHWAPATAGPDEPALMLLTSGSTGVPKGVPLTHRNVVSRTYAAVDQFGLRSDDTLLNWLPMDHVGGIVMMHVGAVCLGQSQVQIAPEVVLANPLRWIDLLSEHRAALTWAPHFAFAEVNRAIETETGRGPWDLSGLRVLINGGEAVDTRTAADFMASLEPHGLPFSAMVPTWGMSETSSGSIVTLQFGRWLAEGRQVSPVGRPLPGMALRIADDHDQLVQEGETGHLQVRGPMVIDRYAGSPQTTADAFTADGWFRTGDIGMVVDGQLLLTGRSKDVVVINGSNVSCQEIEALVQRVPGVRDGHAAACPFRSPGAQTDGFVVIFAPADETAPALNVVREVRRRLVSEAGLSPIEVLATVPDAIPRTNIGKVRRPDLLQGYRQGALPVLAADRPSAVSPVSLGWRTRTAEPGCSLDQRGSVLVVGVRPGFGATLAATIRSSGAEVIAVADAGDDPADGTAERVIDIASARDWTTLLESLRAEGRAPDVIALTDTYESGGASARTGGWQAALTATAAVADTWNEPRTPVVAYFRDCDACSDRPVPYLPDGITLTAGTASSLVLLAGRDMRLDAADACDALRGDRLDPVVRYREGVRCVPWSWSTGAPDADATLPEGGRYVTWGGEESLWSALEELIGVRTRPYAGDPDELEHCTGLLTVLPDAGPGFPYNSLVAHQDLHEAVRLAAATATPMQVVVTAAAGSTRQAQDHGLVVEAFQSGRDASRVPASDEDMLACVIRAGGQEEPAPEDASSTAAEAMRRIWSRLLGRPVGADENVFSRGADSLMVQRFLRSCDQAGWLIDAFDVFSGQTVRQMSVMARPAASGRPAPDGDSRAGRDIGAEDDERRLIEARLNGGV